MLMSLVIRLLLALFRIAVSEIAGCHGLRRGLTHAAGRWRRARAWPGGIGRYGNPTFPPGVGPRVATTRAAAPPPPRRRQAAGMRGRGTRGSTASSPWAEPAGPPGPAILVGAGLRR